MAARERRRAVVLLAGWLAVALAAAAGQAPKIQHFVPARKGLDRAWVRGLTERGERRVYRGKELAAIGMPVGGIAAGQLYLRGDGTLALWQIFNKHVFTGYGAHCYRHFVPASPVDSGFAVTVATAGSTVARRLNRQEFPDCAFLAEYPIGLVRYQDKGFPVRVELEAFSPFIPLDALDSALPATVFHLTVENASQRPVRTGVFGWLENAVCLHSAKSVHALRRSRIVRGQGRTLLVHTAEKAPTPEAPPEPREKIVLADFEGADYGDWTVEGKAFGTAPARGTLPNQQKVSGFRGKGLVNTYLGGDDKLHGTLTSPPFTVGRKFLNFLIGGGNHKDKTCIHLLVGGKAVRTAIGRRDEKLLWHFWNVEALAGQQARLQIVDKESGPWGHINIDQVELADVPASGPSVPLDKLPDFGSLVLALASKGETTPEALDASWPAATSRTAPGTLTPSSSPGTSQITPTAASTPIASTAPSRSPTTCSTSTSA